LVCHGLLSELPTGRLIVLETCERPVIMPDTVTVTPGPGVVFVQVGVTALTDAGAGFAVVWQSQTMMPPESRDLPK
jgi:hypothetical protein